MTFLQFLSSCHPAFLFAVFAVLMMFIYVILHMMVILRPEKKRRHMEFMKFQFSMEDHDEHVQKIREEIRKEAEGGTKNE